jgi:hypothetical protein
MFVAPDEALLGTAREATRRSMAWVSVIALSDVVRSELFEGLPGSASQAL